ncbi:hypothetical protein M1E17_16485 [Arthrobacter sp. D1-29]
MAPGLYGADIEQLRTLSKTMGQSGSRLKTVESTVNSLVQSAAWKGADGDRFRSEWTSSLRPMLSRTSESLESQSQLLLKHADEQDQASNSGRGAASSPAPSGAGDPGNGSGPERNWGDAFTDPDYEHAPGGIQWLLEKAGVNDGSAASSIANALKFAADKFSWNLELAQVEAGVSKFFGFMGHAGKVLGVLGGAIGVLDVLSGIDNKDPFRIADGVIGGGLSVAAVLATGTIVGAPAGVVLGGLALGWGLLGMMSGDVPVTKRIWDFGAGVVGGVKDLSDGAGDALGWVGGKLGFG